MAVDVEGTRHNPYLNHKFQVLIDGFVHAGFQKASGLKEETAVVEYREGNNPITAAKLPGQVSYDNIVLERGVADHRDFRDWRREIVEIGKSGNLSKDGQPQPKFRRVVTIEVHDKAKGKIAEFVLTNAWPAVYEVSELNADDEGTVLTETLELAHEGWEQILDAPTDASAA